LFLITPVSFLANASNLTV